MQDTYDADAWGPNSEITFDLHTHLSTIPKYSPGARFTKPHIQFSNVHPQFNLCLLQKK